MGRTMIRFACLTCKAVLERPESEAGAKLSCPACGQRLQVPAHGAPQADPGRSVAPGDVPLPPGSLGAGRSGYQVRSVLGREHVFWDCPACQGSVDVAVGFRHSTVHCPHCSAKIAVPEAAASRAPVPPAPAPPAFPPPSEPPVPLPVRPRYERADDFDEPVRRRRADRYDRRERASRDEVDYCIRSATSGLTCSLIGLGLMLLNLFLWVAAEGASWGGRDAILFLVVIVTLAGFVLGLLGVVFSARGLNDVNQYNRGSAVSGLVCGIICLVITVIVGVAVICVGLLAPWRWTRW